MYENRSYLIIPVGELAKVDFSQVGETSADTVRQSVDETTTFIKWNGTAPAFIAAIVSAEGPSNHSEILTILATEEWTAPMEEV